MENKQARKYYKLTKELPVVLYSLYNGYTMKVGTIVIVRDVATDLYSMYDITNTRWQGFIKITELREYFTILDYQSLAGAIYAT